MHLTFIRDYLLTDQWSVDTSDPRNQYPSKWTLVIQLIQLLSYWLKQPFTWATFPFDYIIIGFEFFSLNLFLRGNSIDTEFHEV